MVKPVSKMTLVLVGLISLALGIFLATTTEVLREGAASPPRPPAQQAAAGGQEAPPPEILALQNTSRAFVAISKEVTPAVVSIHASRTVRNPHRRGGPLEDFFRQFRTPQEEFHSEGLGSGVLVRPDGYILTNNHVIEDADDIEVTLLDGRTFPATIVGRDPSTDVAVIHIEGTGLPSARLGDSDRLEVGEWVLAIGNPMHLPFTVTAGIISALGRNIDVIPGSYSIESFIQTDAAINPGNSGGPLTNIRGEVIGINSAISTGTGFYQGYGFAIPINLARRVMEDLIREGHVVRAVLGVSIQDVNAELARALDLPEVSGVLIEDFTPEDSPAHRAGLQRRDVILTLDGEKITRVNQLQSLIARHHPGDVVRLAVWRGGAEKTFAVTLGERPAEGTEMARTGERQPAPTEGASLEALGLAVRPLGPQEAEELGIPETAGLAVTRVDPQGPAASASPYSLEQGDVILEVGRGQKAVAREDLQRALDALGAGERLLLFVRRPAEKAEGETFYTTIAPGAGRG